MDVLQDFLVFICAEKGLAENSVEAYKRELIAFFDFLNEQDILCAKEEQIVAFLAEKHRQNYAPASVARTVAALKTFFRFLKRENYVEKDLAKFLHTPKLWLRLPEILSQDEVEKLLGQPDTTQFHGARDRAILELLYASGLRVSELSALTLYSVGETFVRVKGKGGKERLVPIHARAIQAIDHYLSFRESAEPSLFVTRSGKPLDRIAIWHILKKYAKMAEIKKPISPHTLRHTFATHLLNQGADLRVIQEFLGHSTIKSTDRYTQVNMTQLCDSFHNFHPRK